MTKSTAKAVEKRAPLLVHEIDARLAVATARRAELDDLLAVAALDLVSEPTPGENHLYDQLAGQISAVDREINALTAAKPIALANQRKAEAAARDAVWRGRLEACHSHLRLRDKAAVELTQHLQGAVAAYAKMIESGRKARAAAPLTPSIDWRAETFTDDDQLKLALQHELFRLGPWDRNGTGLWPGSINPHLSRSTDPSQVKAFADVISTASRFIIARFKGEVLEEHTEPEKFVHAEPIDPTKFGAIVVDRGQDLSGLPTVEDDGIVPPRQAPSGLVAKGSTPLGRVPS